MEEFEGRKRGMLGPILVNNLQTHPPRQKEPFGNILLAYVSDDKKNADYEGMVQASKQQVAPCAKVVE